MAALVFNEGTLDDIVTLLTLLCSSKPYSFKSRAGFFNIEGLPHNMARSVLGLVAVQDLGTICHCFKSNRLTDLG